MHVRYILTIAIRPSLMVHALNGPLNGEVVMSDVKRISRKEGFGLGQGIPDGPDAVKRALAEVMSAPWVDVSVMSAALGIGRNTGYREAQEGRFGAFKVAGQYRIPTAGIREALRLPAARAEQVAA